MWPLYDLVRCPTLLLRGAESDLLTRDVAQQMAARGPRPSVIEFAGVGHAPSLMHADQISVIRDFLLQTDANER
jgi:pimeloyl-ACP methyl ester carboxylesterase